MPVYKTYGRIGNGPCIVIIIRNRCNPFQIIVQWFRLIIAATTMQATIITVKSALHRIATVR